MPAAVGLTDIHPMTDQKNYKLTVEGDTLTFRTSSFKAEKSSVLHSGVYSKEFMSILFASGACMFTYMLLSPSLGGLPLYTALVFMLVAAFTGAHRYIFKEKYLETVFNRSSGTARLIHSGAFSKKAEEILLANIDSVEIDTKRFEPENKDGADFVQKISVQHGSAVPGLGEPEEFVTLSLRLKDGSEKIIYADNVEKEPDVPVQKIREFIFTQN